MTAKTLKLMVFAYGMNYARRPDALEIDPITLSLQKLNDVLGKRRLPARVSVFVACRQ
jgi:hypothetical protein